MRTSTKAVIAVYVVAIATSQAQFPEPVISANNGVVFRLKDDGYRLVGFHFNVNKPLHGVSAGDHAIDLHTKTGDEWVHTFSTVHLQPGDTVHYWVLAIKITGPGLQITERSWTYVNTTTTSTTTTTATIHQATTAGPSLGALLSGNSSTAVPGPGSGSNTGNDSQPNTGSGSNAGIGSNAGSGSHSTGSGSNEGIGSNTGRGSHSTGSGSNTGISSNTGSGSTTGNGSHAGSNTGSGSHTGSNSGSSSQSTFSTGGSSSNVGTGGGSCNCAYGPGQGDGFVDDRACQSFPCLIFEDNFDFLNHRVWEHEITAGGGGNWEFQWYTNNRTNSYTRDGVLYIKPTLTSDQYGMDFLEHGTLELWGTNPADVCTSNMNWGCKREGQAGQIVNPIQSARLRSSRGFNFRYGKVEVEAKLPAGDWLWPAIWMLPRMNVYGKWPASGEIDIMESRGNRNYHDPQGVSKGVDSVGSTLHFGADYYTNQWTKAHKEVLLSSGRTYADDFHRHGVEWDNTSIIFSVDGQETLRVAPGAAGFWELGGLDQMGVRDNPWRGASPMAPFDQEFYLIMNVAVGGVGFFPDKNTNSPYPKPWQDGAGHEADRFWAARGQWYPTWHPDENGGEDAAMKVNYVKVWKTKPDP